MELQNEVATLEARLADVQSTSRQAELRLAGTNQVSPHAFTSASVHMNLAPWVVVQTGMATGATNEAGRVSQVSAIRCHDDVLVFMSRV